MSKVERFEDLDCWKMAREITNRVYDLSEKGRFVRDYGLKTQMRDACISIMSNISEGFERDWDKEHAHFLSYSQGSAGEVRSQLYIALDRRYITKEEFDEVYKMLVRVALMINGFIKYLKESDYDAEKNKK
jgi:four helix bundle protein